MSSVKAKRDYYNAVTGKNYGNVDRAEKAYYEYLASNGNPDLVDLEGRVEALESEQEES